MERRAGLTAAALAAVFLLGAAGAAAAGWCPLSVRACGVPGLPSSVVEGIIHVESSGRPWAIGLGLGTRHRSLYPATRRQARLLLRVVLGYRARANVGVGLMQVNWLWWGDRLEGMGHRGGRPAGAGDESAGRLPGVAGGVDGHAGKPGGAAGALSFVARKEGTALRRTGAGGGLAPGARSGPRPPVCAATANTAETPGAGGVRRGTAWRWRA